MRRRYELIVFDWDGTLMNSEAKIVRCLAAAAGELGLPGLGEDAMREVIGLGMEEAARRLFPIAATEQRQNFVASFREHYLHLDRTRIELFPGVSRGLRALVRQGYVLAVATGRPRRGLERMLAQTKLQRVFAATRCADEAPSKPHPQMLSELLAATGIPARNSLMVGDTVHDMEMARNASIDGLAVGYGAHTRERLLACGALACVNSFTGLRRWLD